MTASTICVCGQMIAPGELHQCDQLETRRVQQNARRNNRPKATGIWQKPQWRRTSQFVIRRDGETCVDCHRHRSELNPNERLVADHLHYNDPFNPETCVTRCSTCSGRKDGGRRYG